MAIQLRVSLRALQEVQDLAASAFSARRARTAARHLDRQKTLSEPICWVLGNSDLEVSLAPARAAVRSAASLVRPPRP